MIITLKGNTRDFHPAGQWTPKENAPPTWCFIEQQNYEGILTITPRRAQSKLRTAQLSSCMYVFIHACECVGLCADLRGNLRERIAGRAVISYERAGYSAREL